MRSARLILNHANRGSRASPGGSDLALCATCRNATRTRRSNLMTRNPPVALDLMLAAHGSAPLRGPEWRSGALWQPTFLMIPRPYEEADNLDLQSGYWPRSCLAFVPPSLRMSPPWRAGACQFRWRLRNVPLKDCLWIWDYLARV